MRAGAFADLRVIQLINRRFVPFFFNTGGPGLGHDTSADEFIDALESDCQIYPDLKVIEDPRKRQSNTIAYFAAFSTIDNGSVLGVADGWINQEEANNLELLYPGKDEVFDFLLQMLEDNPSFNKFSVEEEKVIASAQSEPENLEAQSLAAQIFEELGQYESATRFLKVITECTQQDSPEHIRYRSSATCALMRIARYQRNWTLQKQIIEQMDDTLLEQAPELKMDVAMEQAYQMLANENYETLQEHLIQAIEDYPNSHRLSEYHYYAGVASFFMEEMPTAYYHWCWIWENLPEDRLARRAYISAAHKSFPYPNFELGGFRSRNSVGNQQIQAAYDRAKRHYDRKLRSTNE